MELAGVVDFFAALARFGQNLWSFAKGEEEPFTWPKVNNDIVAAAEKCTGIPTATLIRDFEAFLDTIFDMTDWYEGQYAKAKMLNNIGLTKNRGTFVKIYYEAVSSGDDDAATMIYNDMLVNGITGDEIRTKCKTITRNALESETEDMRGLVAEWNALPEEERTPELKREYQSRFDERFAEVEAMGYSDEDINKALQKKSGSSAKSGKYLIRKAYKAYSEYQDNPTGANKEKFFEWYYQLLDAGYDDEDILAAFAAMEE